MDTIEYLYFMYREAVFVGQKSSKVFYVYIILMLKHFVAVDMLDVSGLPVN